MHKNWVTRLAGGASALALATAIALTPGEARAYQDTILDHPLVGSNASFSRIETWNGGGSTGSGAPSSPNEWFDNGNTQNGDFLGPDFSSSKIEVEWSNKVGAYYQDVTIRLFTNLPQGGQQVSGIPVGMADVFFDTTGGRTWNYAFDIFSRPNGDTQARTDTAIVFASDPDQSLVDGTKGTLYSSPVYETSQQWADDFDVGTNFQYGGKSNICAGSTDAECEAGSIVPPTEVTGGWANGGLVDVSQTDAPNDGVPPLDSPKYIIEFTLAGINTDGSWDAFNIFWGTGWCSNDSIEGTAVVPIPAALPMLLAAIGGLGIAGWRQRRKAA